MLIRSRILRENGRYIPRNVSAAHLKWLAVFGNRADATWVVSPLLQSFQIRKHFFNNDEKGFFKTEKRKPRMQNPMGGGYFEQASDYRLALFLRA